MNITRLITIFTLLTAALMTTAGAQRLTTAQWPFGAMPTEEQQAEDPASRAYAQALEAWLEQNPGTSLEQIEFDIWNQEAIVTGLAGGTAPTFFNANVLGGWNPTNMRAAFLQGLAADVTEEVEAYDIPEKLEPNVRDVFEEWQVNGRFYTAPESFVAGQGVYYRKDLLREAGLEEPTADWTWDDFLELARALTTEERRGAAIQPWMALNALRTSGWDQLTWVPAPDTSWNWRFDYTTHADIWAEILETWRRAINEEGIILTEASGFGDGQAAEAFLRGDAAMMINNYFWYTRPPTDEQSLAAMADRHGVPLEDFIGWISLPRGVLDTPSFTQPSVSLVGINPDASPAEVDKAISLYDYMMFGDGYVTQRQAVWEATEDLRFVFTVPVPINGMTEIPGVPGTIADAWGEEFIASANAAANSPRIPQPASYIPAETAPGPGEQAINDAYNLIIFSTQPLDIEAELASAERIMNQQAASFRSAVDDETFTAAARDYYEVLDAFYAEHAPQFHTQVFGPWLEANVTPVLGND